MASITTDLAVCFAENELRNLLIQIGHFLGPSQKVMKSSAVVETNEVFMMLSQLCKNWKYST